MSVFAPRYTPKLAPDGTQVVPLSGATELLTDLLAVPQGANSARVQGLGRTTFAYRMDGSVGEDPSACLVATTLPLRNLQEIQGLTVAANGGATDLVVQFFTGSAGL